jgi:hypothetical protein
MSRSEERITDSFLASRLTTASIRKVQEVILWRRPFPLILVFIVADFIFIFIYKFRLNFFSTVLFLAIVYNILRFVYDFAGSALDYLFFRSPLPDDPPDRLNRIRTPDEVVDLLADWEARCRQLWGSLTTYAAEPSWDKHLTFFGTLFIVFVITTVVGTFAVMVIIVHAILIIPGMSLNPTVREFVREKIRAIEAAGVAPADPKEKRE